MPRRTCHALVAAVAALATALAGQAAAARAPGVTCAGTGRVLTCQVPLPAQVRARSNTVRVLLPADYATSRKRFPVVYVLHGVGDDYSSWTEPTRGNLGALTASCEAIFVMPDGGGGTTAGWYSDWLDGSAQYETFHTVVLPAAIDRTLRTRGPGHRAVAGLSMGGFGALSYTARHPHLYQATASYSGFADTLFAAPASGTFYDVAGQNAAYSLGTPSQRIWGDQNANRAVWAAHNPYDLAAAFRDQPLYLSSGHGGPGGSQGDDPTKASAYLTEAYVGQLNDRLAGQLTALGIPFTDGRELGGRHDWPYWRANFTASLRVLMPALGTAGPGCGRPAV